MVMTWLVHAMDEDISANYVCYSNTRELRKNVCQMYPNFGNQSQVYDVMKLLKGGPHVLINWALMAIYFI